MPKRYDKYGFKSSSIEEAKRFVEDVLGIRLDRHDSSYWGVYFSFSRGSGHDYMLYENSGEYLQHSAYREYPVMLNVNDVEQMDEIKQALTAGRTEPVCLRSKVVPDPPPDDV
jgi:catechol 2,3-dioxygenase-like lactoylglutathione lyase family enzyme